MQGELPAEMFSWRPGNKQAPLAGRKRRVDAPLQAKQQGCPHSSKVELIMICGGPLRYLRRSARTETSIHRLWRHARQSHF